LFSKKDSEKFDQKGLQKEQVKMAMSKMTCQRWHLHQVGEGSFGVPFDQLVQKTFFSCNDMTKIQRTFGHKKNIKKLHNQKKK